MIQVRDHLIVSLDCKSPRKAFEIIDDVGEYCDWFKVGPVLFTQSRNTIIDFLHSRNKNIFLDLKLYDTPTVVHDTVRQFGDLGVSFVTVHTLGGRPMLEAAGLGLRGSQLRLVGVTLLTSQSVADPVFHSFQGSDNDMVSNLVGLALEHRLAGVLCSPHELKTVKAKVLPGFLVMAAGIRFPGEEVYQDDQIRVASPKEALAWGADYLIVGRPITLAREPKSVAARLLS